MTPIFCCGFECDFSRSNVHWAPSGSGSTIETGTVRSGSRALKCTATSGSEYLFTVSSNTNIWVGRFYIRFVTLPDADVKLFGPDSGDIGAVLFKQSDSKIYAGKFISGAYTFGASGVSVTTNTWYRVDFNINQSNNPWTIDVQVDGVACGQVTQASAASSQTIINIGIVAIGSVIGTIIFDDFIISNTSGDYPIGTGYVNHFVPTSDGTHNTGAAGTFIVGAAGANITNATTTAYQLIDEVPLDDATPDTNDYINQALTGATNYTEHVFGPAPGISTPTTAPRSVDVLVAYHQAGTGAGTSTFKLNDNGTEDTILASSGAGQTSTRYARKQYAVAPTGGAWTVVSGAGNFNNIRFRFGYSSDANPDQYCDCAMIEAEFAGPDPFNSGNITTPRFFKSNLSFPTAALTLTVNLLETTLSSPVQNPLVQFGFSNPLPSTKAHIIVDTSLCPQVAVDGVSPFFKTDWPNPVLKNRFNGNLPQTRPIFVQADNTPKNQYNWPNPTPKKLGGKGMISYVQGDVEAPNPFFPIGWTNPVLKDAVRSGLIAYFTPSDTVQSPLVSPTWRNPIPLKKQTNTWINDLLQTTLLPPVTAAPFPGGSNITPARLPRLLIDISSTIRIEPSDYPTSQVYWRIPESKKKTALSWLQTRPTYYQDIKPFLQTNWLNPSGRRAPAITFISSKKPPEPIAPDPFIPILFPNPQIGKKLRTDWFNRTRFILQQVPTVGSKFTELPNYKMNKGTHTFICYFTFMDVVQNPFISPFYQLPIYDVSQLLVDIRTVPGNAPEVVKPFNQNNWPNPRHKRMNPSWLAWVVMDQNEPFIGQFTISPLPRKKGPVLSWIQVPLVTAPLFTPPAGKQFTNVPDKKKLQTLSLIVESLSLDIIQAEPPKSIDLPNPRFVKYTPIWLWSKPFYYTEDLPPNVQSDWPNPILKQKLNKDWLFVKQIEETVPTIVYDLSVPLRKGRPTETWIIDLLQSTLIPAPGETPFFETDYPNPLIVKSGKGWTWNKPIFYEVFPVPFNQSNWPLFKVRSNNQVGWIDYFILESNPVVNQSSIFTNPLIKKRIALTWLQNILETTISPAPPLGQRDHPNPIYGKRNPTGFIENKPRFYTQEVPFKFIEFPVALKKKLGLTHTDNPIIVLTFVPGLTPFSQKEWPVVLRVKRATQDIMNRGYILPDIRGRVICLLSDAIEYNLESAIDILEFESRFEVFDLESGGDECQ